MHNYKHKYIQRFGELPADYVLLRNAAGGAIRRCLPHRDAGGNYADRGICVYEPWRTDKIAFIAYLATLDRTRGTSLDRINNDGNYEPSNLRFIPFREQSSNRRFRMDGERGQMLTSQLERSIRNLHKRGCNIKDIANLYCVKFPTIYSVLFRQRRPT